MKLNLEKCAFGVGSGKFLGFTVSHRGIEANLEKIKALIEMQSPRTVKEVQQLTGRVTALNRFISRATDKCLPFFKVLRQAFEWNTKSEEAFKQLKQYMTNPPLLSQSLPGETLSFYLAVSNIAVSAALIREDGSVQRSVYYINRALRGAKQNYPLLEKMALALVIASRRLRPYFQAHSIVVLTDQPLKKVMQQLESSSKLMQWSIELSQYEISYRPRTTIKGQAVADFILEFTNPTSNALTVPAHITADTKDLNSWTLSVDSLSRKEGSETGLILTTPEGEYLKCALRFLFTASNNQVEYEALIAGLRLARDIGVDHLRVFSDSRLAVGQITDEFDAKEEAMRSCRDIAFPLTRLFNSFHIRHVPRSQNSHANEMAQLASVDQSDLCHGVWVEYLTHPAISPNQQVIHLLQNERIPWAHDIITFLEQGILPADKQEAAKVKARSSNYTLVNDILYKRGFLRLYLRCLNNDYATYVMREIHEGVYGNHSGGRSLAHKILRTGYFWPTLSQDATNFVMKCDKCQCFTNIPHIPPTELITVSSPCLFAKWGIDLVGPLPAGRDQVKFAVVTIDYFTKWVKVEPLAKITERNTTKFIWQSIVCRFRVLQAIVSDNGK
ncbi:uncharacterized protein LOC114292866 [Camellia sinensis]|uniref:uncharacterized protein LOC114292866 n=1 Tax=Camellia sinensis TaxID=4442 RepID=UPI00103690C6|nr:uncharacterized protein LOC114292866 [Camellia sinensis]